MKVCNVCKVNKEESEFYLINGLSFSSRCKICTIEINKKRHQELFKYNSEIYQCILFSLNEKRRSYVDKDWVDIFLFTLKNNPDFDLHSVKNSVLKRLIQRCECDRVKGKIESEFNKILECV